MTTAQTPTPAPSPTPAASLARLSINQETIKQWSLPELADGCAKAGIGQVGLWRAPIQAYGVERTARLLSDAGLTVTSLCRGGFLTALDPAERVRALDDNRRAVDEAAAVATDTLVLVSGGLPPGSRDLSGARERVAEALAELAPYAAERGVRLAIEPLHPMFASDRCVVSTLAQALDLAERFPAERVGVVVDTYHLWWDDRAPAEIARAGAGGRIHAFQLADWITPLPAGVLLGRGQLGDGSVDFRAFRTSVEAAGYDGPIEVEIFNEELWARDGAEVLAEVAARYGQHAC
ncbi:sugar phosphate isomerase/epimerase [Streptomyces griseobrunneus]|uniref:sugar phosphate isomerase/epimerase family protein n=1 Tax=Streptomyces sp. 196(2019) TaxID=2683820 RepID=UPI0013EA4595|nr:sugar phosphate isomerase/epimerase family protein [Streptomyces sp. 196(2019)]NGO85030.1 TIM barrel protein [Streptomyces sp. 196(2019)]